MRSAPGQCEARSWFHALYKGKNGPQLAVGRLGNQPHPHLSMLALGNVPDLCGGFSMMLFLVPPYAHCAVGWLPLPFTVANSYYIGKHGSVFTASPTLANPYTIRLFKY